MNFPSFSEIKEKHMGKAAAVAALASAIACGESDNTGTAEVYNHGPDLAMVPEGGSDSSAEDAAIDAKKNEVDAAVDAVLDAPVFDGSHEGGMDAAVDALDAGTDAAEDAADAGNDAPEDSSTDAMDAGNDATEPDAADANPDVSEDAPDDITEAGNDAAADAGTDAVDASPDAPDASDDCAANPSSDPLDISRAEMAQKIFDSSGLEPNLSGSKFKDVPESHPNYVAITSLAYYAVIPPYKNALGELTTCWGPQDPLIRAQAAKFLVNGFALSENIKGSPHFPDVPSDTWFYAYVETAYNWSVMDGFSDGLFHPELNEKKAAAEAEIVKAMNPVQK